MDGLTIEPSIVKILNGLLSIFLIAELDVDIAHQVVPKVVTDIHLLYGSIIGLNFHKYILKKVIEVLLLLLR